MWRVTSERESAVSNHRCLRENKVTQSPGDWRHVVWGHAWRLTYAASNIIITNCLETRQGALTAQDSQPSPQADIQTDTETTSTAGRWLHYRLHHITASSTWSRVDDRVNWQFACGQRVKCQGYENSPQTPCAILRSTNSRHFYTVPSAACRICHRGAALIQQ